MYASQLEECVRCIGCHEIRQAKGVTRGHPCDEGQMERTWLSLLPAERNLEDVIGGRGESDVPAGSARECVPKAAELSSASPAPAGFGVCACFEARCARTSA